MSLKISSVATVLLALPSLSWACSVCFGDPASPAMRGLNAGILVLLGVVGVVFTGVIFFLVGMRKRMRQLSR